MVFILANSADPYAAFHVGPYCLIKCLFTGIQNENGQNTSSQFKMYSNNDIKTICTLSYCEHNLNISKKLAIKL